MVHLRGIYIKKLWLIIVKIRNTFELSPPFRLVLLSTTYLLYGSLGRATYYFFRICSATVSVSGNTFYAYVVPELFFNSVEGARKAVVMMKHVS